MPVDDQGLRHAHQHADGVADLVGRGGDGPPEQLGLVAALGLQVDDLVLAAAADGDHHAPGRLAEVEHVAGVVVGVAGQLPGQHRGHGREVEVGSREVAEQPAGLAVGPYDAALRTWRNPNGASSRWSRVAGPVLGPPRRSRPGATPWPRACAAGASRVLSGWPFWM